MSNIKPPAFQFYAKDFLASPTVRSMLELCSVGAYIMLLASAWDSDPVATLPNDDEKLRRLARATPEEWAKCRDEVMANFEPFEDGTRLVNARLREQYEQLAAYTESVKQRGRAGAAKRWSKPKHDSSNGSANAKPMTNDGSASAVCNLQSALPARDEKQSGVDGNTDEQETFVVEALEDGDGLD